MTEQRRGQRDGQRGGQRDGQRGGQGNPQRGGQGNPQRGGQGNPQRDGQRGGHGDGPLNLLLLAGTSDARNLAARLSKDPRLRVTASLAGVTRTPEPYAVPMRSGGFGGRAGFDRYLAEEDIGAVIDATHPFARTMPHRAAAVCAARGTPYLRLLRPAWVPERGDRWHWVADAAEAAEVIAPGLCVFLATGRGSLSEFAPLAESRRLVARVIDPPGAPFPFAGGAWLVGRPPFTVEDEIRTFRGHGVDVLVVKASGGPTEAKLTAARRMGLPVVMLRRPAPPPGARVESVEEALAWLEAWL